MLFSVIRPSCFERPQQSSETVPDVPPVPQPEPPAVPHPSQSYMDRAAHLRAAPAMLEATADDETAPEPHLLA